MTAPAAAGPCAGCGHDPVWHPDTGPRRCLQTVYQYVGSNSGPGIEIPRPCPCTGYTPKETVMMPEPAAPPAAAPTPQAAADVLAILEQLRQAYLEVHSDLAAAHETLAAALSAAHQKWHDRTAGLEAQLRATLRATQTGGQP